MILFRLIIFLLMNSTSFLAISAILRFLYFKKDEYLNIRFDKFVFKNIIFFIITYLFLTQITICIYLSVFHIVKIHIMTFIMPIFPLTLVIFIYAYIELINSDKIYKDNDINRFIKNVSTSKELIVILLTSIFIHNSLLCFEIYRLYKNSYEVHKQMEIQTNTKKQLKYDKEIKYDIMIDRLFERIDINVTDEDIEEYKNNIKQKYKMEE